MFDFSNIFKDGQKPKNEIVSRKGSRSNIKLPDGSQVWLNADSKLSYNTDFHKGNREVSLIGEAYFDVVKDAERPFIIHTDKIDIRVLGTAFNVKSYPQDDVIETALIHGKIEVTYKDRPAEKVILMPNEKLIIRKDQQTNTASNNTVPKIQLSSLVPIQDSLLPETAWLSDKLVFTNETLGNIAEMLERRFDVEVDFLDNEVQHFTYTGIFEHEPLAKILELMSLSQKFDYVVEKERVSIKK
jgi:ferric-dicitrate binding protein FerR (iron transport regulator)